MKTFKDFVELSERMVSEPEFNKKIDQAFDAIGSKKHEIPKETSRIVRAVDKLKINTLDLRGEPGRKRNISPGGMYEYYAYTLGWGHTNFTRFELSNMSKVKNKVINQLYKTTGLSIFGDDAMKLHVQTDLQTYFIVANISKGSSVEPAYYLVKDYYNSHGLRPSGREFDTTVKKVNGWLKMNKIQTL